MDIPWQNLQPETIQSLIEEFVSRDGTDYGENEVDHETKVMQIRQQLLSGKIKIVFDPETESCDLREAED